MPLRLDFLAPPGPPTSTPRPTIYNDAMRVRTTVFVDEQGCSVENEQDEDDERSWHWVAYDTAAPSTPVGVVRLVPPPHAGHEKDEEPCVRIGRLPVIPTYRGKGLGRVLVETALGWAAEHADEVGAALGGGVRWKGLTLIHAQVDVEPMYARLGFITDRSMGEWSEEGIPHVGMWKTVDVRS